MAKSLLFHLFFFTTCTSFGQVDTIEVSRKYKTILIFPEDIAESIIGNDFGFVVDLPKENGSRYNGRILKLYYDDLATEQENYTNHTVITDSGNVYDLILKLVPVPERLTWLIEPEMAVANIGRKTVPGPDRSQGNITGSILAESPGKLSGPPTGTENKRPPMTAPKDSMRMVATYEMYKNDPMEYYRLRCYYMQFDKARIGRYFSRADNVFLWLKGVYYNKNELYVQLKVENKEGLDLDVNFFKYSLATSYNKSGSNQKLELRPVFVYKQPKTVEAKSENHFVVVFKKFALDEKKELLVELDEESGNRNLSLGIGHEIINNPISF